MEIKQNTSASVKDLSTIKADAIIAALMVKTHAEIDTWVNANVTNIAQAQVVIKKILYVIRYILNAKS